MGLKPVYNTLNLQDAELLRAELRSHGIESFLENEFASHTAIGLPTTVIPLIVNVDASREQEALDVVLQRSQPRAAAPASRYVLMTCAACGKALEMPEGEDPPEECPWCDRPPEAPAP